MYDAKYETYWCDKCHATMMEIDGPKSDDDFLLLACPKCKRVRHFAAIDPGDYEELKRVEQEEREDEERRDQNFLGATSKPRIRKN